MKKKGELRNIPWVQTNNSKDDILSEVDKIRNKKTVYLYISIFIVVLLIIAVLFFIFTENPVKKFVEGVKNISSGGKKTNVSSGPVLPPAINATNVTNQSSNRTRYSGGGGSSGGSSSGGTTTPGCISNCSGKTCGDDGCSGSCGTCNSGYECENSSCVIIDPNYPIFSNFLDNSFGLNESGIARFNVTVTNTNETVFLRFNGINYRATRNGNNYNVSISVSMAGDYNYYWYSYGNGIRTRYNQSEARIYRVNGSEIHITQEWINARTEPYLLDRTGATYILDVDVSTNGTSFWILGDNIIFDLNGHTINYDQLDIPNITNGNFETNDFTGWDLSGALGYYRRQQLKSIGEYVLALPNSSVVLSPVFRIPKANYSFVSSLYTEGMTGLVSNLSIDFIRVDNGEGLACGYGYPEMRYNNISKDNDEEFKGISCDIQTSDTPEVRIRIRTQGPMVIDYVDFRGFLHPAIASKNGEVNANHQYFSYRDMPLQSGRTKNITIVNGTIIQGNARSGKGIVLQNSNSITIDNLRLITRLTPNNKGIEQSLEGVNALAGGHKITNSYIEVPNVGVFNRDTIGGAIMISGDSIIFNNTIKADTSGIFTCPSGRDYIEGLNISNNNIELGFNNPTISRNHFGIRFCHFLRPYVYNNIIYGQGHGGINIDNNIEAEVFNNNIRLWAGKEDLRFGATGSGDALDIMGMEFYDYGFLDGQSWSTRNKIYNNNVTVIIDPDKMKENSRMRVVAFKSRNRESFIENRCGNNSVFNNSFTAINLEPDLNSFGMWSEAIGLSFFGYTPDNKDEYYDNIIEGNNVLIEAGMHLTLDEGVLVRDNILRKINTTIIPAPPHQIRSFEYITYWETGGVVLRDNIWENNDKYNYWYTPQSGHIGIFRIENSLKISVKDNNNNSIPNANIIVRDNQNQEIYNGLSLEGVDFVTREFEVNRTYPRIYYNPHNITIIYNGNSDSILLNITNKTNIVFNVDSRSFGIIRISRSSEEIKPLGIFSQLTDFVLTIVDYVLGTDFSGKKEEKKNETSGINETKEIKNESEKNQEEKSSEENKTKFVANCIDNDKDGYNITVVKEVGITGNFIKIIFALTGRVVSQPTDCGQIDCNDSDAAVNPSEKEVCNNSIDDNCNSLIDCNDSNCIDNVNCKLINNTQQNATQNQTQQTQNETQQTPLKGIPNGYISYWKFEGSLNDERGISNGVLYGNPFYVNGILGKGVEFNSIGNIKINSKQFDISNGFTHSVWVYTKGIPTTRTIATGGGSSGVWWSLVIQNRTDSINYNIRGYLEAGELGKITQSPYNTSFRYFNQWIHVVFTRNDTNQMIYINGEEKAKDSVLKINNLNMSIGYIGYNFTGIIDEVMFYNRGLSSEEVRNIYCNQGGQGSFC